MHTDHRLDDIHMSAIDREHAKTQMRRAELIVDFIASAVAGTRLAGAALVRRASTLARRIQLSNRRAPQ